MDGEREYEWEEGEGVLVRKRLIKDLWENGCDLRVVSRLLAPRRWFRASGGGGGRRAVDELSEKSRQSGPRSSLSEIMWSHSERLLWLSGECGFWSRTPEEKNNTPDWRIFCLTWCLKSQISSLVTYGSVDICPLIKFKKDSLLDIKQQNKTHRSPPPRGTSEKKKNDRRRFYKWKCFILMTAEVLICFSKCLPGNNAEAETLKQFRSDFRKSIILIICP